MQIKSTKSSSILTNLFLLLAALVVMVILVSITYDRPSADRKNKPALPKSTTDFMRKKTTLFEVLEFFHDHTILLAVKDEASQNLTEETRERLAAIGGEKLSEIQFRNSYVGLFQNGQIVEEKLSASDPVSIEFEDGTVTSAGQAHGNYAKLDMGNESWYGHKRGLKAFVIGKNGSLLGIWNFDFYAEKNPLATTQRFVPDFFENVPVVEIELKAKHYARLENKREEAMQTRLLIVDEEKDIVPARIIFDGKKHKADIRLKGDWVDHLDGESWSFRVKLDKGSTLMGMRKFSLHRPDTRNYTGEWLYHEMLRDADILNLQYHFVQVKLSIKSDHGTTEKMLGLYALEEFFDKQLIERGRRREGVILKLDEAAIWDERATFLAEGIPMGELSVSSVSTFENLPVVPFGKSRVMEDSALYRQFETGAALFRDYVTGKKPIHQVFDVERLAMFTAISNLLGSNHGLVPHNVRVYFNPVTARLEPIGYDGNSWKETGFFSPYFRTKEDLVYQAAYLAALEKVTEKGYLEKFMEWPRLEEQLETMSMAYPELEESFDVLFTNRGIIRNSIFPERSLKVYFDKIEEGFLHLTVENYGRFPVEILGVENDGGRLFGQPSDGPIIIEKERKSFALKLDKNFERLFIQKGKGKSKIDVRVDFQKVRIQYKTLGTSNLRTEEIFPWGYDMEKKLAETPSQFEPNAHEYDFLVFDENTKTITVKPGNWQSGSPIIVPGGYTFRAGPGTRIDLTAYGAQIISHSPLDFRGTADSPVEIVSQKKMGMGLFVFNTSDTSHLEYCRFENLSNPHTEGWALSGAVNFYEAPVTIRHCHFMKNRCEDALNIFRSWFDMQEATFSNIYADAFDGDFVEGKVSDSRFIQIGNDAIDVSGSKLEVENVRIAEAGDKGLSAGEDSKMTARNVTIEHSEIALASKDKSVLSISHSELKNNALGFTAFQKKPEFGPAKIIANALTSEGHELEFLIETGSSLKMDGEEMPTESGVVERMYGEEFGRKSGI